MKKTLIAVAALSAMAASAMAANVMVYGLIDIGFNYQHNKVDGEKAVSSFTMATGQNSGSRYGFKGTEELGNGTTVGFLLEGGFESDTGILDETNNVFRREANLYVTTDFGTLSLARVGALTSGTGSYNLLKYAAFGSGWGDSTAKQADFMLGDRARMDNTITYVTPSFSGVKAYIQYSFQRTGKEAVGNERQNNRYAGFGLSFNQGAFSTALVVDSVLNNSKATNKDDSLGVTWGASYDFGVAKLFAQAQYGKHENALGFKTSDLDTGDKDKLNEGYFKVLSNDGIKGYAASLGVTAPVAGGTILAQVNYLDSKTESDVDFESAVKGVGKLNKGQGSAKTKNYGIAVGYTYPFSKRTSVYSYASYSHMKATLTVANVDSDVKAKVTEVGVGLIHKF